MTGLILKDLYNIGHNAKAMGLLMILLAGFLIPSNGLIAYLITCVFICSMMLITTMSFDDTSKWDKYAIIMPVSRKNIVLSKYILLFIFSIIGVVVGTVICGIVSLFIKSVDMNIKLISIAIIVSILLAMTLGSIIIPLLYKYGAEKARILMIVCFLIPILLFYIAEYMLKQLQIPLPSENVLNIIIGCSPIFILLFIIISFKISLKIFENKEL